MATESEECAVRPGTIEAQGRLDIDALDILVSAHGDTENARLDTIQAVEEFYGGFVLQEELNTVRDCDKTTVHKFAECRSHPADSPSGSGWHTIVPSQKSVERADGSIASYEYGRLKTIWQKGEFNIDFNFSTKANCRAILTSFRVSDALGNHVAFFYDQQGRVDAVVDRNAHWIREGEVWRNRKTRHLAKQLMPGPNGSYTYVCDGPIECLNHKIKTICSLTGEKITSESGYIAGKLKVEKIYTNGRQLLLSIRYRDAGKKLKGCTVYGRNGKLDSRIIFGVSGTPEYRFDYLAGVLVAQTWYESRKRARQIKYREDGKTVASLIRFDNNGLAEIETIYGIDGSKHREVIFAADELSLIEDRMYRRHLQSQGTELTESETVCESCGPNNASIKYFDDSGNLQKLVKFHDDGLTTRSILVPSAHELIDFDLDGKPRFVTKFADENPQVKVSQIELSPDGKSPLSIILFDQLTGKKRSFIVFAEDGKSPAVQTDYLEDGKLVASKTTFARDGHTPTRRIEFRRRSDTRKVEGLLHLAENQGHANLPADVAETDQAVLYKYDQHGRIVECETARYNVTYSYLNSDRIPWLKRTFDKATMRTRIDEPAPKVDFFELNLAVPSTIVSTPNLSIDLDSCFVG